MKNDLVIMQKVDEHCDSVSAYNKDQNATTATRLARAYASSGEIFWKKMKKIVFMAGLNPQEKYISINRLDQHLKKLEEIYSISLGKLRSFVNAKLRNSIGHEDTYFEPPETVVFLDNKGGEPEEVERLTTYQIYELLVDFSIVNLTIHFVDNVSLMSHTEPLLRLTDQELDHYCKTGKLSDSAKKKFDSEKSAKKPPAHK